MPIASQRSGYKFLEAHSISCRSLMKNEARPSDSQCTKIFLCLGDVLNLEASRAALPKSPAEIQHDGCVDPLLNFYAEN